MLARNEGGASGVDMTATFDRTTLRSPPEGWWDPLFRRDSNRRRARSGARASSGASSGRSPVERGESADALSSMQDSARGGTGSRSRGPSAFVLYVEGPRDREILACWARRFDPGVARCIESNTVILGGRQPARAQADFRKRGGGNGGLKGLVVLDRDDHPISPVGSNGGASLEVVDVAHAAGSVHALESGLEIFVWSLRHIESYLLVPAAIRRVLGAEAEEGHVDRILTEFAQSEADRRVVAATDATANRGSVHAKRILGAGGSLSEALGAPLRAGEIARAMRSEELHDDIRAVFGRIATLAGLPGSGPEVVIRASRSDPSS